MPAVATTDSNNEVAPSAEASSEAAAALAAQLTTWRRKSADLDALAGRLLQCAKSVRGILPAMLSGEERAALDRALAHSRVAKAERKADQVQRVLRRVEAKRAAGQDAVAAYLSSLQPGLLGKVLPYLSTAEQAAMAGRAPRARAGVAESRANGARPAGVR